MSESQIERIGAMYDEQAADYAAFKGDSFAWQFIEMPAFDRYLTDGYMPLPNLYRPDVHVLDIGCGSGLVAQHLITQGVNANNITGIDLSPKLLEEARARVPGATFIEASSDNFDLPNESFDLVTSNMVFHYLNDGQLKQSLDLIYKTLRPGGTLFFVDADPDYSEETRRPENVNRWLEIPTPWGGTAPWFSRDPYELLLDTTYYAGFDVVAGFPLPISEAGKQASPDEYAKYTSYPARMGARLAKVSNEEKQRRLSSADQVIPSLTQLSRQRRELL